jgi:polyisoprenoid-binding protein YceI
VLVAHLASDDFFDVELYPEARFVITGATPILTATPGAPNLTVHGQLTIKGVTQAIDILTVTGLAPEGQAAAQAVLAIDRTLWNVIYGSGKFFRHLGGHLVNDLIEVQLRIVTE